MALPQQKLVFNGEEMMNLQRLSSVGVGDGDLVRMVTNVSRYGVLVDKKC